MFRGQGSAMRIYRGNKRGTRKRPPRRQRPRGKPPGVILFLLVFTGTIAIAQAYLSDRLEGVSDRAMQLVGSATAETSDSNELSTRVSFSFCHKGGGHNCVVDGDTIWFEGTKIRIADIDAPETHDYQCQAEKELGDRATTRLREILEGGHISLQSIDRDEDRYGRKLRIILVDGDSVGAALVDEGLARWYEGGRRPWC